MESDPSAEGNLPLGVLQGGLVASLCWGWRFERGEAEGKGDANESDASCEVEGEEGEWEEEVDGVVQEEGEGAEEGRDGEGGVEREKEVWCRGRRVHQRFQGSVELWFGRQLLFHKKSAVTYPCSSNKSSANYQQSALLLKGRPATPNQPGRRLDGCDPSQRKHLAAAAAPPHAFLDGSRGRPIGRCAEDVGLAYTRG